MHRICVPGFIIQGTGQKRRPQSKCGCKMHHRYGQGFRPNMQFAPLCQMHGGGGREKMQRVATMAQFAQPNRTIFRLAQWRIGMLSRNGITIKRAPPAQLILFFVLWRDRAAMDVRSTAKGDMLHQQSQSIGIYLIGTDRITVFDIRPLLNPLRCT